MVIFMDKLIELRSKIKRKKPDFNQDGSNMVKRIRNNRRWRRPVGSQSKVRLGKKGQPIKRKSGYSSPKSVRGLLKNGLMPVIVCTPAELEALDKTIHACVIASGVGKKKRIALIKAAESRGIFVYNYKDTNKALSLIEEELTERKKQRQTRLKKKKEVAKPSKKAAEPEKPVKAEKTDSEQAPAKEKAGTEIPMTRRSGTNCSRRKNDVVIFA